MVLQMMFFTYNCIIVMLSIQKHLNKQKLNEDTNKRTSETFQISPYSHLKISTYRSFGMPTNHLTRVL